MRFDQLAALTGGRLFTGTAEGPERFRGVSIDSRTLGAGELFVAIRGENRDGHEFIPQAVSNGAAGVLAEFAYSELEQVSTDLPVVAVDDSHEAMIALAKQYRHSVAARFVGITGSNGKTTTKELAYHLIAAVEEHTYRSPGNLNNLYGVPLALFKIPESCRVAVLEMGISTNVEMPRLVEIVDPDVVLITNVSATHLEFLKTVEDVAKAKLELVRAARDEVPAIINADDAVLMAQAAGIRQTYVTFGIDNEADFRPESWEIGSEGAMEVVLEGNQFVLPLVGKHQVYNLTAAYAIARTLGFDFQNIDTQKIRLETAPMRGQMITRGGVRLLVDCYNANPENVKAGLAAYFAAGTAGRRVVILGDMLELGEDAKKYHRETGAQLAGYDFDLAVFVGPLAEHMKAGAEGAGVEKGKVRHYASTTECAANIDEILMTDDFVYIKGSRGIGLEEIWRGLDDEEEEA